jgi:NAD(P)-dependent dehydrogenase (short-subunit alcohol dehydrogenase family)
MSEADNLVVITGGAGGIGSACAHAMAGRGKILLADLDSERLHRTASELTSVARDIEPVHCDIADPESIIALAQLAVSKGKVASLIHTAGIDSLMGDARTVFTVDYLGTAWLLDAFFPYMVEGAAVVCLSSIARLRVPEQLARAVDPILAAAPGLDMFARISEAAGGELTSRMSYGVAKYGVAQLCRRLAGPWGARGVRIASISPGLIDTPMGRLGYEGHADVREQAKLTPLQRGGSSDRPGMPGRPGDIAAAAAFLCSEYASFITGCDLIVDGGLTAARAPVPF